MAMVVAMPVLIVVVTMGIVVVAVPMLAVIVVVRLMGIVVVVMLMGPIVVRVGVLPLHTAPSPVYALRRHIAETGGLRGPHRSGRGIEVSPAHSAIRHRML